MSASKALRAYSAFLTAATFFLVIAGGMVTSTGSGLAVPDWPLSFGQFFPEMKGGVFYEHGHRMIAATVGFLTVLLAIWLWRVSKNSLLRNAGWFAVFLVCLQGVLGGVTVLLKLPAAVSVSHACLGQIFFCTMACIAALVWAEGDSVQTVTEAAKIRRLGVITMAMIFLQLLFGAIYRHTGMMLHAHFLGAFLVFVHVLLLVRRVRQHLADDPWFSILSRLLILILFVQIGLGLWTWQRPTIPNATTHQAVGALLFAGTSIVCLLSFRRVKSA